MELAALPEGSRVTSAVLSGLRLREEAGRTAEETLIERLRHGKTLLILDNCEHVLEGAAPLVATLLAACPDLPILCTSREPLGVMGELDYRLTSLRSGRSVAAWTECPLPSNSPPQGSNQCP